MSVMTAPSDAAVLAELKALEAARTRLHAALREAAFSFTAAQRAEEATRGRLVSFDAVPVADGTLTALATITSSCLTNSGAADGTAWELTVEKGSRRLPSLRRQSSSTARDAAAATATAAAADSAPPDPIYYFSENPSSTLRECQTAFQHALVCVVATVNAQQRVLAAAAAAAMATPADAEAAQDDATRV
ncbi:hypothetical protein NESM_000531100 [Novymonas esmeraldas]|uniref:Uncharacterized protein n=1 Tax=Novymonas esmeraldas TaxID=1808958 RepID=A0AAW0ETE3_9TRYP